MLCLVLNASFASLSAVFGDVWLLVFLLESDIACVLFLSPPPPAPQSFTKYTFKSTVCEILKSRYESHCLEESFAMSSSDWKFTTQWLLVHLIGGKTFFFLTLLFAPASPAGLSRVRRALIWTPALFLAARCLPYIHFPSFIIFQWPVCKGPTWFYSRAEVSLCRPSSRESKRGCMCLYLNWRSKKSKRCEMTKKESCMHLCNYLSSTIYHHKARDQMNNQTPVLYLIKSCWG